MFRSFLLVFCNILKKEWGDWIKTTQKFEKWWCSAQILYLKKQSPEVFCKKCVLRNFTKFT